MALIEKREFTQWCSCGADHCIRVSWFSDETDEAYMTVVDALGARGRRTLLDRLKAAWRIVTQASVCHYSSAEVVLTPEDRQKLAAFLLSDQVS